jgi:DNA-binding MarR family transcriptional regulator
MKIKQDYLKDFVEVGQGKFQEEILYATALIYTEIFNDMSEFLAKFDLSPAQLNMLMIIKHQGKEQGLNQKDLSRRLMVTASNTTRMLVRLQKEGLIERGGHHSDKRINMVKITVKGSKILDKVWPHYIEKVKMLARGLSSKEQRDLSGLLQKWLGMIKKGE